LRNHNATSKKKKTYTNKKNVVSTETRSSSRGRSNSTKRIVVKATDQLVDVNHTSNEESEVSQESYQNGRLDGSSPKRSQSNSSIEVLINDEIVD
jgi:hypothetical protein